MRKMTQGTVKGLIMVSLLALGGSLAGASVVKNSFLQPGLTAADLSGQMEHGVTWITPTIGGAATASLIVDTGPLAPPIDNAPPDLGDDLDSPMATRGSSGANAISQASANPLASARIRTYVQTSAPTLGDRSIFMSNNTDAHGVGVGGMAVELFWDSTWHPGNTGNARQEVTVSLRHWENGVNTSTIELFATGPTGDVVGTYRAAGVWHLLDLQLDLVSNTYSFEHAFWNTAATPDRFDSENGGFTIAAYNGGLAGALAGFKPEYFGFATFSHDLKVANFQVTTDPIPEPAALGLMLGGLAVAALRRFR